MIRLKLNRLTRYEIELANLITNSGVGLHCERIAGSGRRMTSICDCILTFFKDTYFIELKTTKNSFLRINGKIRIQLQRLMDFCKENEYNPPILVIKFLRRGFVFAKLDSELIKYVDYYDYNKTPIKIRDFLSNGHKISSVSFEGVEKVRC